MSRGNARREKREEIMKTGLQAAGTGLLGLVVFGLMLFLPAWTFNRHPMYVGVLIMMVGIPLALDSWWGLVILIPGVIGLAFRILDEEKMLEQELDGYSEYTQKVHYRLVPYVW
jgi:protein-S-isoprenylcysteine O-methyltransferase Ste14